MSVFSDDSVPLGALDVPWSSPRLSFWPMHLFALWLMRAAALSVFAIRLKNLLQKHNKSCHCKHKVMIRALESGLGNSLWKIRLSVCAKFSFSDTSCGALWAFLTGHMSISLLIYTAMASITQSGSQRVPCFLKYNLSKAK